MTDRPIDYHKQYIRDRMVGDPAVKVVLEKIEDHNIADLARRAGVSAGTIHNWKRTDHKRTRNPQNLTVEYVLRAAGFRREIVPITKA